MRDSRLQQIEAAFGDARTLAADIIEEDVSLGEEFNLELIRQFANRGIQAVQRLKEMP